MSGAGTEKKKVIKKGTGDSTKVSSNKALKPIGAQINHKNVYRHMIESQVQGETGKFVALREAVNNSFDAGATSIRIRFGKHEGQPALIISDNGFGFSAKGVRSAMSYAHSANERSDIKTIGANGTGLKTFLGLGDLDVTKLTILSVHRDHPECRKMNINFKYILDLIERKTKAENHVEDIKIPKDWLVDLARTTGSTVILTGYDSKRLGGAKAILKHLGEYLTPKACQHVEIYDDNKWQKIRPVSFRGKNYKFSYKNDTIIRSVKVSTNHRPVRIF